LGIGLRVLASFTLLLVAASSLSGCTSLPSAGASASSIEAGAAIKVTSADKAASAGIDYALVDISKSILGYVADAAPTSISKGFGGGRGGAPALPIGVGDVVQVSIFESQSGGLFIPSDAGSRPGNFVSLPQQTIDRDGTVSVPYAGRIRAVGRSVEAVQKEIEDRLANRAIEPQALITKISSRSAQVAVLGDVRQPAKVELTEAGERILDVISEAGGLSSPGIETRVTLQRGSRTATVLYDYLVATPGENIYVAPGDTVLVDRERRTYVAFGASGLNGRFDFEESKLTFGEALAKAGGVLDARADPGQVFLYRVVQKDLLTKFGVDVSRFATETVPVVFRANMRDPGTLFAIQKFPMQDKDIIYITNADSVELLKFLNIVNSVSTTAAGVPSDAVSVRDSVRALSN
jgi:polysaccharide export outer membrane protein